MPQVKDFQGFISLDYDRKVILLNALGYGVDREGYIIEEDTKKRVVCKYTNKYVKINGASILPGSTVIINTSPVTLSEYIEEYLE